MLQKFWKYDIALRFKRLVVKSCVYDTAIAALEAFLVTDAEVKCLDKSIISHARMVYSGPVNFD